MLVLRIGGGLLLAYVVLTLLGWLFQERLTFPAPAGTVPDPRELGLSHGERIALRAADGSVLAGWYLGPAPGSRPCGAALLWFYGNGETIAAIWPLLHAFQAPGAALMAVDYPGYGGSTGRPSEGALYAAAEAALAALARRPGVDPRRVVVYGRSLGSAVAVHTAANHDVAGLILDSPFTSAAEMARLHYRLFPRALVRLRLDNLTLIPRVRCPVLVFHGTADRLVPLAMGRRVAAAAASAELVELAGADHNTTYEVGGSAYRERVARFVLRSP